MLLAPKTEYRQRFFPFREDRVALIADRPAISVSQTVARQWGRHRGLRLSWSAEKRIAVGLVGDLTRPEVIGEILY